ncbi:MAG TPA: hypothetical protein PKD91_04095 [Bacteroidia bacterium]|nr:hypothetical protein [Bacteroidia bacterium]
MNLYLNDTYERLVEKGELPIIKGDSLRPSVERFYLAHNLFSPRFRNAVLINLLRNDLNDVVAREISTGTPKTNLDSLTYVFKKKYSIK